jgi:hypothetical protein
MIDIDKLKLPVWVWYFYPKGQTLQIIHLTELYKGGTDTFASDIVYSISDGATSVENAITSVDAKMIAQFYSTMNHFKRYHETVMAIFS